MTKEIGVVGLGKMGGNISRNLNKQGYTVTGFDVNDAAVDELAADNTVTPAYSVEELVNALEPPRVVWLSVPKGDPVDNSLEALRTYLEPGDVVIDGGNSDFRNAEERYEYLREEKISFLDAGCSGGPEGALHGMSVMVGGDEDVFEQVEHVFDAVSVENGYAYFGGPGTGHMVKNVHNGVEYGMMEAIAEGLEFLHQQGVDPEKVSEVWSNGSVVESYLVKCVRDGLAEFGTDLEPVSGRVPQGGTGRWTVEAGAENDVDMAAIRAAVEYRDKSLEEPGYRGKLLRVMRYVFGGHSVRDDE